MMTAQTKAQIFNFEVKWLFSQPEFNIKSTVLTDGEDRNRKVKEEQGRLHKVLTVDKEDTLLQT